MEGKLSVFPIDPTNGLQAYIKEIMSYPLLTEAEEMGYAFQLRNNNDLAAAQKLVLSHLRLVVSISKEYAGYCLPQADLIQEGNIGLMHAVKKFDPTKGVRLVTFATYSIKAAITSYIIKNWRLVKTATTKAQRKLFFNLKKLKKSLSALTMAEAKMIAQTLNVKESEVIEANQRMHSTEVSIDKCFCNETKDETYSIKDLIADHRATPEEALEQKRDTEIRYSQLKSAIDELDQRAREIILSRWLVENSKDSRTLQDLAKEHNISAERVRQIESQALAKIKEKMLAVY